MKPNSSSAKCEAVAPPPWSELDRGQSPEEEAGAQRHCPPTGAAAQAAPGTGACVRGPRGCLWGAGHGLQAGPPALAMTADRGCGVGRLSVTPRCPGEGLLSALPSGRSCPGATHTWVSATRPRPRWVQPLLTLTDSSVLLSPVGTRLTHHSCGPLVFCVFGGFGGVFILTGTS